MEATKLKVICAWCNKDMGTKDGQGVSGISHGICPECCSKMDMPKRQCLRCGHEWAPRTPKPLQCPKCHSPYWQTARKEIISETS